MPLGRYGQIEELQNQQHRLEDQLKRFQEDIEFRLNGGKGAAPIAEAPGAQRPVKRADAVDPGIAPVADGPTPIRPAKRSDGRPPPIGDDDAKRASRCAGRPQRAA